MSRSGYAQLGARDLYSEWIVDCDDGLDARDVNVDCDEGITDRPGQELALETVQPQIRAVQTFHLLRCFGQVFDENIKPRSEEEAVALFQKSQNVDTVDYFVTHSWQGSRVLKWAVIADFFNRGSAIWLSNYLNLYWLMANIV
eukprot:6055201-Amphidinium_carterae.1